MHNFKLFLYAFLLSVLFVPVAAQLRVYPSDMVCKATGLQAGTAYAASNRLAINAAIQACMGGPESAKDVVYLDTGTYYIDGTLEWVNSAGERGDRIILAGSGRSSTKLILAAGVAASSPVAMVKTNDQNEGGATGPTAWANGVWDLTLDVGQGNPHAIGIDWCAHNWGSIERVKIESVNGPGKFGIDMNDMANGPNLIKDVEIEGFKIGIMTSQNMGGVVLENLTLKNQTEVGIRNCLSSLTIRGLHSENSVPVIRNYLCADLPGTPGRWTPSPAYTGSPVDHNTAGMLTLIGAVLTGTGGASGLSAIENDFPGSPPGGTPLRVVNGTLFVKGVTTTGYASAVRMVPGTNLPYHISGKNLTPEANLSQATSLPVEETPVMEDWDTTKWVRVEGGWSKDILYHGGIDHAVNVATALAQLTPVKSTLYFPPGYYYIESTITIPPQVKRIIGYGATIFPKDRFATNCIIQVSIDPPIVQEYPNSPNCNPGAPWVPLLRIEGGTSDETLHIEGVSFGSPHSLDDPGTARRDRLIMFQHLSPRPLKISFSQISDVQNSARVYEAGQNAGNLFLENVSSSGMSRWEFGQGQKIWARQFDPEGHFEGFAKVLNNGGKLWVLGLKTENPNVVLRNTSGGQAEIYGGYITTVDPIPQEQSIFENVDGSMTLTFTQDAQSWRLPLTGMFFPFQIRDVQGSQTRLVQSWDTRYWGFLTKVAFYYGHSGANPDVGEARYVPSYSLLLP